MAGTTVLDIVQDLLSGVDSDEVNSLNDTLEAQQAARFVKRAYDQIMVSNDLGWVNTTFQLDSQADTAQPTHMTIPSNIHQISWIRYNMKETLSDIDDFRFVIKLDPSDFLAKVQAAATFEAGGTSQLVMLDSLVKMWIRNDRPPRYWTTFDDKEVIFDSFDEDVDDCLQTSKTACYGQVVKSLVLNDDTPVDLPPHLLDILYKTAENMLWARLKDVVPPEMVRAHRQAEVRSQRLRFVSNQDSRNKYTNVDYGRRGRGSKVFSTDGSNSGETGPPPYYTP